MKIQRMKKILAGMIILGVAGFTYLGAGWPTGQAAPSTTPDIELKRACIKAAIRGIELEITHYQNWIDLREQKKVDDAASLPRLKEELQALKADLQKFQGMKLEDYQLPEKIRSNAWIKDNPSEETILYVDKMSRSGPWYHLSGILGDNFNVLKPNTKYMMTFYKVYPRSYFNMDSAYVYIAEYNELSKQ